MEEMIMKKILVPVDGSEISLKAADEAVKLAKKFGSEVIFLSVVEMNAFFYSGKPIPINIIEVQAEFEKHATQEYEILLNTLVEKYRDTGLVLKTKVLNGLVDQEIEEFAKSENIDLIVMGRRGLSPVKRFIMGSTTRKIVTSGPCSVLVVKE
jgi:nucleotide-binding universal stress UspA family protein